MGMIAGQMPRGVVVTSTCRMEEACSRANILGLYEYEMKVMV
jgi:hypothetical protein